MTTSTGHVKLEEVDGRRAVRTPLIVGVRAAQVGDERDGGLLPQRAALDVADACGFDDTFCYKVFDLECHSIFIIYTFTRLVHFSLLLSML